MRPALADNMVMRTVRDRALVPLLRLPTRLDGELGHRWALAAPAPVAPAFANITRGRLGADTAVAALSETSGRRAVMLVRPDGHLGGRAHH
ncbi:hypothetical protein ASR50_34630 [Streptomyces sp. 4F]|nr:hypothetical protein ASR50_00810 [Streptomyces sp. 4F]ALV54038.1 hypothetical protein ASR50_34630 [Streptomyces sp. 4F]